MCAGVTVYKGIKETEARPGQFITIIGAAGGLGHLACQYARAMGLRVIAVDIGAEKKQFCQSLGVEQALDIAGDCQSVDHACQMIQEYTQGGSHAVLVAATEPSIYGKAVAMCRRKGTVVFLGIMGADAQVPIADLVLRRITIRGSNIGTRQDTREALDFAVRGLVNCHLSTAPLDQINDVYAKIKHGEVQGRVVLQI
jgi:propanol-preferring alcohol dehydrogenase